MQSSIKISLFLSMSLVSVASSAFVLCAQNKGGSLEGAPVVIRTSCPASELAISTAELENPPSPSKIPRATIEDNPVHENLAITVNSNYDVSAKRLLLKNNQIKSSKPGSSLSIDFEKMILKADDQIKMEADKKVSIITTPSSLLLGKSTILDAADDIVLKTGNASITMKKDGNIFINGVNIDIRSSNLINVKATKDVVLKGSKITGN